MEMVMIVLKTLAVIAAPVFGYFYDKKVAKLEEDRMAEGDVSLLVAVGCGITVLLASTFIGWLNALIVIGFFMLTGVPMILGSKKRYHLDAKRAREEQDKLAEVENDKEESERV